MTVGVDTAGAAWMAGAMAERTLPFKVPKGAIVTYVMCVCVCVCVCVMRSQYWMRCCEHVNSVCARWCDSLAGTHCIQHNCIEWHEMRALHQLLAAAPCLVWLSLTIVSHALFDEIGTKSLSPRVSTIVTDRLSARRTRRLSALFSAFGTLIS